MPRFKKALNIENLKKELKEDILSSPDYINNVLGKGIAGSKVSEPIPQFTQTKAEKIIENGTNAYLVVGKDRPGSILSGYGGRGDSGAGSIDMVVGRMSHNPSTVNSRNENLKADPDFKLDASRIYISQKTDIDDNFDLVAGKVGSSTARSGIGIKSDAIRLIGREGIKLVTGTDTKGSHGEDILSVSGIDLIAGNDDANIQPLVLGDNVNESLEKMADYIDKLAGIVSSAIVYQMKFNTKVASHTHITAFFGTPTAPSEILIPAGVQIAKDLGTKSVKDLFKFRTNIKFHKQTYYAVSGKKYINSRHNNTN